MLALVLLLAGWPVIAGAAQTPLTDPEPYAVYSAVIPTAWPVRVAHATRPLIQDTTEIGHLSQPPCYPEGAGIEGPWAAALADFKQQNAQRWALRQQFQINLPYDLERKEDIDVFFAAHGLDGWKDFNTAHPDAKGYFVLSAVGFDAAKSRAIVYVAHHCGGLCGQGNYHFLERQEGTWKEVRLNVRTCGWIS